MKLNLIDTVLMSLIVALLMIGGHQTYVIGQAEGWSNGFFKSYWIFMLMLIVMIILNARRNKAQNKAGENGKPVKNVKPVKGKNKGKK